METLELLLHPVRLRILHAMAGGTSRTTSDLCERLPDVSKATMYRHVAVLHDAGVLVVEGERRVHGAVERTYSLDRSHAYIDDAAAARMTREDHRRMFAAAMATLAAEFEAYLDQPEAAPFHDLVGYRQIPLWLNRRELASLLSDARTAIEKHIRNAPRGRRPYLLMPILFPLVGAAD